MNQSVHPSLCSALALLERAPVGFSVHIYCLKIATRVASSVELHDGDLYAAMIAAEVDSLTSRYKAGSGLRLRSMTSHG